MDVLRDAIEQLRDENIKCYVPPTGIYASIEFNDVSVDTLVNRLSKYKVLLNSTNICYIDGFPHSGALRLCVCKTDDDDIRRTIALISQEVKELA